MLLVFLIFQRYLDAGPRRRPGGQRQGDTAAATIELTVTKRFGDVVAVDDVTLEAATRSSSSSWSSGCGKTTLLRMIAGLETVSSGRDRHRRTWSSMTSRPPTATSRWSSITMPSTPTCGVADNLSLGCSQKAPSAVIKTASGRRRRCSRSCHLVSVSPGAVRRPAAAGGGRARHRAPARARS